MAEKSTPKKNSKTSRGSAAEGRFGARDIVQVLLTGLVLAAVIIGITVAVVAGTGQLPQPAVPPTADPQQVASVPTFTPEPTATEVPCEAQAWWDASGAPFNTVIDALLAINLETPPQQVVTQSEQVSAARDPLGPAAAPCIVPLQGGMRAALDRVQALYSTYLTPTTEKDRAIAQIGLADALLPVIDAASSLQINTGAAWISRIESGFRGECPAERWFLDVMQVRDYQSFTALGANLSADASLTDVQNMLIEMRRLRSSWDADSVSFPACTKAASDRWLAMMDAMISGVNARLNGDAATADGFANQSLLELNNFLVEARALGIVEVGGVASS